MAEMSQRERRAWLRDQVADYKRLFPAYAGYAGVLEQILEAKAKEIAPQAIVQTRPKAIASFAEKALRKAAHVSDPAREFTDLCGGRVICRTPSEVEAFCRFVEEVFEIDIENSEMKGEIGAGWRSRLAAADGMAPAEFGYRSVHYIVSLKKGADYGVKVPASLPGLKAEVQVRTTAEHSWADFGHDLSYKGAFELPAKWKRELAVIAAQLEDVDRAYDRIERGLYMYASSYGSNLGEQQLRDEIATLETVRRYDQRSPELAARIGKLAMTIGDWEKAVRVMSRHVKPGDLDSSYPPLLRDLGVSLCKLHGRKPAGRDFRRGQRYLEKSIELSERRDPDALASLAGTWRRRGDGRRARELYRAAFEVDPSDFYPLTNYLEYEIRAVGDTSIVAPMGPAMRTAIERCRAQAEVGVNLPWVFFGMAKLHLLLGEPYESLRAYAKAVQASTAAHMIEGALDGLRALAPVREDLDGYEWARRMLLVGLASKFVSPRAQAELRKLARGRFSSQEPVVIVVGGTGRNVAPAMRGYRALLLDAFRDFDGTILSGATKQGVSGLVGEVARRRADGIRAVGYLPRRGLPRDATPDPRYAEIRRTEGAGFSPLEPLQNWIDLIAAGADPKYVKVLGINGGDIAAVEYRIALALGASVGVVEQSGREASRLLADERWVVSENLVALPRDPETIRAFIGSGAPKLGKRERERIAADIHERHRTDAARTSADPYMRSWDELDEPLKDSSRKQADHIFANLREVGCTVAPVLDREIVLMSFTDKELERLSEMEHGRWNAERLLAGWRWGERKDTNKKLSPYLVPWSDLPEHVRRWDRDTVREIPKYLASVGLEVQRKR